MFSHFKYVIVSGFRKTSLCRYFCWQTDILEYEYVKDKTTNYLFYVILKFILFIELQLILY